VVEVVVVVVIAVVQVIFNKGIITLVVLVVYGVYSIVRNSDKYYYCSAKEIKVGKVQEVKEVEIMCVGWIMIIEWVMESG